MTLAICLSLLSGIDHHHDVCDILKDLNLSHLIDLGSALGLSYIKCKECSTKSDIVACWLRKEDNVLSKSGEPTWSVLEDALEKIRQRGIAESVRTRRVKSGQQVLSHNTDQSSSNLGSSAGGRSEQNIAGRLCMF